jgi:large conductance mechanosensitive channel
MIRARSGAQAWPPPGKRRARKRNLEMLNEFKTFIARGNVLDLAVGVVIGAAFTAIVTSLVDDLINPLIGLIIGGIDFSGLSVGMGDAQFMYGNFINAIIKFLIVAWVIFLIVKGVNRMMPKKEEAPAAPAGPSDNDLLKDILSELKKK